MMIIVQNYKLSLNFLVNSDLYLVWTLVNSDLKSIRTLVNSDPIFKKALVNSDLVSMGSELTSGRGPN